MIEKMTFVTLAGPRTRIDHLVNKYLSKHDIHLENALAEFNEGDTFTNYTEANPFREKLNQSHELLQLVHNPEDTVISEMSVRKAEHFIDRINEQMGQIRDKITLLEADRDAVMTDYTTLSPFQPLEYTLKRIRDMEFFKYRFGKLPVNEYEKFVTYLEPEVNAVFINCFTGKEHVYGVFFAPAKFYQEISKDFQNIHFDEIVIPDKYSGTPSEECAKLMHQKRELDDKIESERNNIYKLIESNRDKLMSAIRRIESAYSNFDVRKYSAVTKRSGMAFQVLCGWMTTKEALALSKETENDANVICLLSDDVDNHKSSPPTKLKNPWFLKPFEMFVKMYGLPGYNEFDPTWFLALTYAFIFGIMFGDLGQGFLLFLGGLILYRVKKMDLAGIICAAGIFSCLFGALFGSVFGFEFESLIKPLESMVTLPFIGEINIVLVAAFLFGAFLILTTMVWNIATGIKQKNLGKALFGPNAVSGFIFYAAVILIIVLYMSGSTLPATAVLLVMIVLPLLLIFLQEPLKHLVNREKGPVLEESAGIFAATSFFELFDYLITYLSNSLSFLRVGVFAISHAAMMQVVMTLAGAENGGNANIFVVIIGNLIVLAFEGLVVGIQVLRLEYYEIFGRFYDGSGREFIPYSKKKAE